MKKRFPKWLYPIIVAVVLIAGVIWAAISSGVMNRFSSLGTWSLYFSKIEVVQSWSAPVPLNREEITEFARAYQASKPSLFKKEPKMDNFHPADQMMGRPSHEDLANWAYNVTTITGKTYGFAYAALKEDDEKVRYYVFIGERDSLSPAISYRIKNPDALKNMPGVGECFR